MNIDVVIVTHFSASLLPRVLRALPEQLNVFVVDNASTDGSAEVAASYGATVVRGTVNAGFAAGCNRGAALGTAKKILFLNPDAVIEPEALELLVKELDDHPQVAVASPRLVYPDGSRQQVQWPYPTAAGAWREAFGLAGPVEESSHGFVIGACFLVRREAFEAVGGFDERFWLYGEEADLCRRIEDAGWLVRRFPSATAIHIGGASGGPDPSRNDLVFEHFMRGGEHFVAKHEGRGPLVSYRAANLVGSLGRGFLGVGRRSAEHRARAGRLVRSLSTGPGRVAVDSPATRASGKSLVLCSLEAWDEVWRRNLFFVRELVAADPDLQVLFVEPAFDVLHERRRGSGRRHRPGLRPVEGAARVMRFEPVKWLPRKLGPYADRWRDAQVLDAVRRLGFDRPRLWVNDPSYATLADAVDWPAVYDITDDWTRASDPGTREAARRNEARLFARCEKVVVCSPDLLRSRRVLRDDAVLIPNGVDAVELQRPRQRPEDLPGGDTAVYVGTLHTDRLDVELTARLARELDDTAVVLVGPDSLDAASRGLLDAAGVVRLGPRPYAEVPGYLQHASVLVVPHVVSEFTESLDPIKAYESLAVGTPTVATPVAGFRDLGGPVTLSGPDEFADTVRGLIADRPAATPVPTESWATRADAFAAVLDAAGSAGSAGSAGEARAGRHPVRRRRGATRARRLVVNARYRQRPVTGVERYASELDARLPAHLRRLQPGTSLARPPLGHVWEQVLAPSHLAADEVLWSPCNTGPALLDRHIVTIHDISPVEHPEWFAPSYARWLDLLTRQFVARSMHLITVSEFTKSRLCDRLGADPERISVVPNGISSVFTGDQAVLTDPLRRELGLDDRPYLLSVATFEPRKNLHTLIDAVDLARETFPDLVLVIAGNAGRSDIFADGGNGRAVVSADSVRHLGYVADDLLPALYQGAEALVYVPHYEGFGLPPLEAAATGTSSILSDIPPLREFGMPATWVDPTDVESVAAGIVAHLSTDPVDAAVLREYAWKFSWDRSFDRLATVFSSLGVSLRS